MIVTFAEVKEYLKVDTDIDDALIAIQIEVAEEYLKNATGKEFTSDNVLAKLYCFMLIENMYELRSLMVMGNEKISITAQAVMLQLQYAYEEES
jgi:uncharacterized phage protein (predicted DNA packaging)